MSLFYKKGFSLIELLVSIGIMVVILTVVVLNQRNYTEASTLLGLADDISVTLAEAQAYGIAVKEVSAGSLNFNAAYGLSMSTLEQNSNTSYIFFVDRNGNLAYDGAWACPTTGTPECIEKVDFSRGNYIESFCLVRNNGTDQCGNVTSRVDITFLRPEPGARIKFFNNGGQEYSPSNMKGVRINLRSPGGLSRSVTVYTTGQISVQ